MKRLIDKPAHWLASVLLGLSLVGVGCSSDSSSQTPVGMEGGMPDTDVGGTDTDAMPPTDGAMLMIMVARERDGEPLRYDPATLSAELDLAMGVRDAEPRTWDEGAAVTTVVRPNQGF